MEQKIFLVTRHLICEDSCWVEAKTKAEAIRKAQKSIFCDIADSFGCEKLGDWETGNVVKVCNYAAEVTDEKKYEEE